MVKLSRRSFLSLGLMGLTVLTGCNSKQASLNETVSNSLESKSKSDGAVSNEAVPFNVESVVWNYNSFTETVRIYYSLRNTLTDKALFAFPLSIFFYDSDGNKLSNSDGSPIESEDISYYIRAGELVYNWNICEMSKDLADKIAKVEVTADYVSELPCYFELESFEGEMFVVAPEGDFTNEDPGFSINVNVNATDSFIDFAKKYEMDGVETYVVFLNDKDELLAVHSERTMLKDITQPFKVKIKLLPDGLPDYSKIKYLAVPASFKLDTLTEVPFGKSPYDHS